MKLFRIIVASPFILIGAIFYKIGELISGEIYTRHEKTIRKNTIFEHKMYQAKNFNKRGLNRTPAKKKRK